MLYVFSLAVFFIYLAQRSLFQTGFSPNMLSLIAETNINESSEFLRNYAFSKGTLKALTVTILLCLIIYCAERFYRGHRLKFHISFQVLLIALLAICAPCVVTYAQLFSCKSMAQVEAFIVDVGERGMDNVTSSLYSMHALHLASSDANAVVMATVHEAESGDARCETNDTTNVILVIGESYNKRHASIYGYSLETTPNLLAEMQRGNLTVFKNVVSPYNTTSLTLKNALSCCSRSKHEEWKNKPLIMSTFKRAGYDVVWWDNQLGDENKKNVFAFSLNSIFFNKRIIESCYTLRNEQSFEYDHQLVDDFLNSHYLQKSTSAKRLLVFHLLGQHLMAVNRYPNEDKYNHFTPDSVIMQASYIDDAARVQIAQYDNATRYNDAVMAQIIEIFRDGNAVLLYFSDHGEEVYDYRYSIGRSHSRIKTKNYLRAQNEVPFMVWCSDKYMKSHPQVVMRLKKSVDRPFMNTDLVQILLDLGEIRSSQRVERFNPISDAFQPTPRIVFNTLDYDSVMNN